VSPNLTRDGRRKEIPCRGVGKFFRSRLGGLLVFSETPLFSAAFSGLTSFVCDSDLIETDANAQ